MTLLLLRSLLSQFGLDAIPGCSSSSLSFIRAGPLRSIFYLVGTAMSGAPLRVAAEELYEKLPVVGGLMRWLKKRARQKSV
jgi:hypothetical protein